MSDLPDSQEITARIRQIGFLARQNNITLSVYPDSSNTLIDESGNGVDHTIKELNFHSWFFETAGFPSNPSNPIIIKPFAQPKSESHSGAVECVKSFYENYLNLNKETKNRIVLQNESDGFWNPVNLFKYFHVYLNEKYYIKYYKIFILFIYNCFDYFVLISRKLNWVFLIWKSRNTTKNYF